MQLLPERLRYSVTYVAVLAELSLVRRVRYDMILSVAANRYTRFIAKKQNSKCGVS